MREYLRIGEITKPQGVHGELKLRPATCDLSRFEGLKQAYLQDGEDYRPVRISVRRIGEDAVFFRMEGIETRDDAEKLRGKFLCVDRAHAVRLDADSTFICDLIGMRGVCTDGSEIGELIDVMQPGGNDVYVFKGKDGEVLVPALRSVVLKADPESGEMLLDAARMAEVAVYEDEN